MNSRLRVVWSFLSHYKYLIVVVLGILVVGFLDENSFMKRIQYEMQIDDLEAQISKYNKQHDADAKKLREIKRNPKAIEKIARERYFMKASDEDIFVLSDDEKPTEEQNETTE